MKQSILITAIVLSIAPVVGLIGAPAKAQQTYSVVNIGSLAGAFWKVRGMSSDGRVTGTAVGSDGHWHAFVWTHGATDGIPTNPEMREMPIPTGSMIFDEGFAVNKSGAVAGYGQGSFFDHAVYLPPTGKAKDLGSGRYHSYARGINDAGEVVGYAADGGSPGNYAFVWISGKMYNLGTLPGSVNSVANAISRGGQVIGESDSANGWLGFLWTPNKTNGTTGQMVSLGPVSPAGISGQGQIVGNESMLLVDASGQPILYNGSTLTVDHAFLWKDGAPVDLGTLPGFHESEAAAVNDRTLNGAAAPQVVGESTQYDLTTGATDMHAALWQDGTVYDLNNLIPAGSGWSLTTAVGITDNGWIACNGTYNGAAAGCVLMPQ